MGRGREGGGKREEEDRLEKEGRVGPQLGSLDPPVQPRASKH